MAAGRKEGLKAAVEATVEAADAPVQAAEEQLPLPAIVPEASEERGGGLAVVEDGAEDEGRRGPGRPPGARNRRTEEWVDFILRRYRSPLVALAETYSRPVAELARELACSKKEAFQIQVAAAKELAPYVHQKQPVSVQIDSRGVVRLIIEAPRAMDAFGAEPLDPGVEHTLEARIVEDGGVERTVETWSIDGAQDAGKSDT